MTEASSLPVDFRRTTLVVRDIERSLSLYRDALGMRVVYDELIGEGPIAKVAPGEATVRLVLLRANHSFVGLLGLMQRLDREPSPRQPNAKAQAGQPILIFNARDLEARFEKIRSTPGVVVETAPQRMEYPAPGGAVIPVIFSAVFDPDGFYVEVNRLIE